MLLVLGGCAVSQGPWPKGVTSHGSAFENAVSQGSWPRDATSHGTALQSLTSHGTAPLQTSGYTPTGSIRVADGRFTDEYGREIVFNGLNVVNKNARDGFIPRTDELMLDRFEAWGINLVRLGINWSALEPEPFQYSQAYLDKVARVVDVFGDRGIYVMLDMHQDLYGQKFDNGAPEWATLDNDLPHLTGPVWSDSYLISPAVQTAFDNFWANKQVPGGTGLQDHYAAAWSRVAERFAGNPMVIGYDIMNEPFIGSAATAMFAEMLGGFATVYAEKTGQILSEEEIMALWSDQQSRTEAFRFFDDADAYARLLQPAVAIHQAFDTEQLQPFYQRVAQAIREYDATGILFLEHGYFSNTGIPTAITCVHDSNGQPDSQCAYAPHAYDLVTDTQSAANPGYNRLAYIYEQLRSFRQEQNTPVLIGEWGAFYGGNDDAMVSAALYNMNEIDSAAFSHTYWAWFDGLAQQPYFTNALLRPVVQVVSGELLSHGLRDRQTYELLWNENPGIEQPSRIVIPGPFEIVGLECSVSHTPAYRIENHFDGARLYLYPSGEGGERRVRLALDAAGPG